MLKSFFHIAGLCIAFMIAMQNICVAKEQIVLIEPIENSELVLSETDVKLYNQIFALIDEHKYKKANALMNTLQDDLLKGHLLSRIYLAPDTITKGKQLTAWLRKYSDLPEAHRIYNLAKRKKAYLPVRKPIDTEKYMVAGSCSSMPITDPIDLVFYKRASYVPSQYRKKVKWSMALFSAAIRNGKTLAAKLHLNDKLAKKHLSRNDKDDLLTALAFAYFIDVEDKRAWQTIQEPLKRAEFRNPTAYWVAGLTAYRMKNWQEAEKNFKALVEHKKAIATQKSAAAFWTTRVLLKTKNYTEINEYLEISAKEAPLSFYGILAQRALGWPIGHTWNMATNAEVDFNSIAESKAGKRIKALIQLEKFDMAESEIIHLYASKKKLRKNVIAFTKTLEGFSDFDERLSSLSGEIEDLNGKKALYPFPNWTPMNGWEVDKAFVYAFVRQESCFKNTAFSNAGARGVMQLMPSTAKLMSRRVKKKYWQGRLHEIPYNLMLGQELIHTLLDYRAINGNILMTIAAYNAGPGNTYKWKRRKDFIDDPLMFVEAIPARETRGFVKKVASNYWIYRSLFGKDLSSIDDVLNSQYPVYQEDKPLISIPNP